VAVIINKLREARFRAVRTAVINSRRVPCRVDSAWRGVTSRPSQERTDNCFASIDTYRIAERVPVYDSRYGRRRSTVEA